LIGKKGNNQGNMSDVALETIVEYAAEDADITLQLYEKLHAILVENKLDELYQTIEAPLIAVLGDMEYEGVCIDADALQMLEKEMTATLNGLESEIRVMAKEPNLNVFSPKQLGEVLFDKMKIVENARTTSKSKQYSTNEETLTGLKDKHPIIPKILELRSLKKLLSSYIESLPTLVNPRTGRIHTSFNQAVTATGRLSSNNPNLQNIPIREEQGRKIRAAFVPSDADHILLSADYSQVELRLMAHLSQDENLLQAFAHNEDVHAATAAKIFHIPIAQVTSEQRRQAKTANFGIIYGISAFGLAQRLDISRSDAKTLIDGYFIAYPKVRAYMDEMVKMARRDRFVTTICGRKRMLPNINAHNAMERGFAERNAINAPIQGSAADIIKLAMLRVDEKLRERNLRSKMILQVHDELVFDVPKNELDEMKSLVKQEMENACTLRLSLITEVGTGSNWLEAH
jgi:DNA polymerase-1